MFWMAQFLSLSFTHMFAKFYNISSSNTGVMALWKWVGQCHFLKKRTSKQKNGTFFINHTYFSIQMSYIGMLSFRKILNGEKIMKLTNQFWKGHNSSVWRRFFFNMQTCVFDIGKIFEPFKTFKNPFYIGSCLQKPRNLK